MKTSLEVQEWNPPKEENEDLAGNARVWLPEYENKGLAGSTRVCPQEKRVKTWLELQERILLEGES